MKRKYLSLTVTSLMVLGSVAVASANVPPPPVNQNIGIPDGVFNNLTEAKCRGCHENPAITKPGYIPDRHHLKVGKTIPQYTDVPYSTAGVSGAAPTYECLSCHQLVPNPAVPNTFMFAAFRDCLICHNQDPGAATVHHRTQAAMIRNCKACHGNLDNPDGAHYIPTYQGSLVTPKTGKGGGPKGEGGCAFCHDAGTDGVSKVQVYTNAQTHHSTGVVLGPYTSSLGPDCLLCHEIANDPVNFPKVRKCENCHSVATLHNIQFPQSADKTILPGKEKSPYYGHIGQQADCWGCHGFQSAAYSDTAQVADILMPNCDALSATSFQRGTSAALSMMGTNLQNPVADVMITSVARLINKATGQAIYLAPAKIGWDRMDVVIPPFAAAASYAVAAVKASATSNTLNLVVTEPMNIAKATCQVNGNYANIKVTGSNLGAYMMGMSASNSGFGMSDDKGDVCVVNAWGPNEVLGSCKTLACPSTVTVDGLTGSATAAIGQIDACGKCHQADMSGSVNCQIMASHTKRMYISAADAKAETDAKGLTCTAVVNNPKNRNHRP